MYIAAGAGERSPSRVHRYMYIPLSFGSNFHSSKYPASYVGGGRGVLSTREETTLAGAAGVAMPVGYGLTATIVAAEARLGLRATSRPREAQASPDSSGRAIRSA
jgi:hypothetical protein